MKKALPCGILASFFFAFTFILNRSISNTGGYWMWSGPLRYLISLPIIFAVLVISGKGLSKIKPVFDDIKKKPGKWFLWSTVGFGCFYLPMTLASTFGESWLTASAWQITIVCGVLLTPLFGKKIPVKNLLISCLILIGIALMEIGSILCGTVEAAGISDVSGATEVGMSNITGNIIALILILAAAVCYPLGNRKTMEHCPDDLSTLQRVFGMTVCSVPFWVITGIIAWVTGGLPSGSQCLQSLGVALFSSVIATLLFFHATDLVSKNPKQLAVVEATQCGEVIFTLLGGIIVLGDAIPSPISFAGIALVVGGMVANSLMSK